VRHLEALTVRLLARLVTSLLYACALTQDAAAAQAKLNAATVQAKLNAATVQAKLDAGGVWTSTETYVLETAVYGRKPIVIDGPTFIAAKEIAGTKLGMIYFGYVANITLRNVTIDGNLAQRQGASYCDGTVNAYRGSNIHFDHVDDLTLDRLTSRNAVCGSGMHVISKRARITNSSFLNNGLPNMPNHWADGLTLLQCDSCEIVNNIFADATDVGLVFGGGRNTLIARNTFRQSVKAFAAFAMDNFNGSRSGDFTNTMVTGNLIECGMNCDFAMNLGPRAWYLSSNILGGTVTGNLIRGGKIGILIGGAGTASAPITVHSNSIVSILKPGDIAQFSCGPRPTWPVIVSPDSVVLSGREVVQAAYHELCP